jgi:hypothetical protein
LGVTAQDVAYKIPEPIPVDIETIPLETEVVRGWRTYTMAADGTLKGSRTSWPTAEMVAECPDWNHEDAIRTPAVAQQHLATGVCPRNEVGYGCGIYSHRTGPEYLEFMRMSGHYPGYSNGAQPVKVAAQCISTGIVVEHEMGYRAEKCRIEQMWLIVPRPCPEKHPIWIQPDSGVWVCESRDSAGPGHWAEILSKKYGVPCVSMPVTEFFMKLDEGSL